MVTQEARKAEHVKLTNDLLRLEKEKKELGMGKIRYEEE